jgi:hypothetical protein
VADADFDQSNQRAISTLRKRVEEGTETHRRRVAKGEGVYKYISNSND